MIERSEFAMMIGNSGSRFRHQDDQADLGMIYRQPDWLITLKTRAENGSFGREERSGIARSL